MKDEQREIEEIPPRTDRVEEGEFTYNPVIITKEFLGERYELA